MTDPLQTENYPWWSTAPLYVGIPFLFAWPIISYLSIFLADSPSSGWRQQLVVYVIYSCWAYPAYLLGSWLLVVHFKRRKVPPGYVLGASLLPYASALPLATAFFGVSLAIRQQPTDTEMDVAVSAARSSMFYTFHESDLVNLEPDGKHVTVCANFLRGRSSDGGQRAYRVAFVGAPTGDSDAVAATAVTLSRTDVIEEFDCDAPRTAGTALATCDFKQIIYPCVYRKGLDSVEVWTSELAMQIRAPSLPTSGQNQYELPDD